MTSRCLSPEDGLSRLLTELSISAQTGPAGVPELDIRGEVDLGNAARLRREIARAFHKGARSLRLKVAGLAFIDSTGLSVLLDAVKTANTSGGEIVLENPSRMLERVLSVSGFAPAFRIDENHPEMADSGPSVALEDQPMATESFEAEGRPENVAMLRHAVHRFAELLPFSPQQLDDIKLAVGEASCNAMLYGCPTGMESIHVTCMRHGRRFSVRISDCGPGFDPDQVPDVLRGELAEGGRGIFFMRCLMDEVSFRFVDGTTVELVKYLPEDPTDSSQAQ